MTSFVAEIVNNRFYDPGCAALQMPTCAPCKDTQTGRDALSKDVCAHPGTHPLRNTVTANQSPVLSASGHGRELQYYYPHLVTLAHIVQ